VSSREFHKIWTEQCEAAHDIKLRYGPQAAFDYVVAEKLLSFAEAAARRPEFAGELPRAGSSPFRSLPRASCGITAVRESCVIRSRGISHAVLRTIGTAIESNCHIDDSGPDGSVSDL
jgi:hypothetical protein